MRALNVLPPRPVVGVMIRRGARVQTLVAPATTSLVSPNDDAASAPSWFPWFAQKMVRFLDGKLAGQRPSRLWRLTVFAQARGRAHAVTVPMPLAGDPPTSREWRDPVTLDIDCVRMRAYAPVKRAIVTVMTRAFC